MNTSYCTAKGAYLRLYPCYIRHFNRLGICASHQQYLLALFHFDGPNGCYPSHETIAEYRGTSKTNLARDLSRMDTLGYIKITPGAKGRGNSNRYDLSPIRDMMSADHTKMCSGQDIKAVSLAEESITTPPAAAQAATTPELTPEAPAQVQTAPPPVAAPAQPEAQAEPSPEAIDLEKAEILARLAKIQAQKEAAPTVPTATQTAPPPVKSASILALEEDGRRRKQRIDQIQAACAAENRDPTENEMLEILGVDPPKPLQPSQPQPRPIAPIKKLTDDEFKELMGLDQKEPPTPTPVTPPDYFEEVARDQISLMAQLQYQRAVLTESVD